MQLMGWVTANMRDSASFDTLTARIDELARVCDRLGRENAALRGEVSRLSLGAGHVAGTGKHAATGHFAGGGAQVAGTFAGTQSGGVSGGFTGAGAPGV